MIYGSGQYARPNTPLMPMHNVLTDSRNAIGQIHVHIVINRIFLFFCFIYGIFPVFFWCSIYAIANKKKGIIENVIANIQNSGLYVLKSESIVSKKDHPKTLIIYTNRRYEIWRMGMIYELKIFFLIFVYLHFEFVYDG